MGKIKIDKEKCKGCYLCVRNCPHGLIRISKELNIKGVKPVAYFGSKCTACTMCAVVCPECIIEVYK